MFLTKEEITELTGRVRSDAQAKALNVMGIHHKRRPNGEIAVLKAHVESEFGIIAVKAQQVRRIEPNWDAVNG